MAVQSVAGCGADLLVVKIVVRRRADYSGIFNHDDLHNRVPEAFAAASDRASHHFPRAEG